MLPAIAYRIERRTQATSHGYAPVACVGLALVLYFTNVKEKRQGFRPGAVGFELSAARKCETMIEERDIPVVMRDGTRLVLDVYRTDAAGKYPVLYACSLHNK